MISIDENESHILHAIPASSDIPFMLNTHDLGQNAPKNISYQEFFLEFIKLNKLFYPTK